jgi:hypothetical protein
MNYYVLFLTLRVRLGKEMVARACGFAFAATGCDCGRWVVGVVWCGADLEQQVARPTLGRLATVCTFRFQ